MMLRARVFPAVGLGAILAACAARAQVLSFEQNGLRYQAETRAGVTIMLAPLPTRIHDWTIYQVAITNGSGVAWTVKAEDFHFQRQDGSVVPALTADDVVKTMMRKASRTDTRKMVVAYEAAIFGNVHVHSTNGYESRRQDALAASGSTRLRAAAAASAIVLAPSKLAPGQSTDGAVFYAGGGKPLGAGKFVVNEATEEFVFPVETELSKNSAR